MKRSSCTRSMRLVVFTFITTCCLWLCAGFEEKAIVQLQVKFLHRRWVLKLGETYFAKGKFKEPSLLGGSPNLAIQIDSSSSNVILLARWVEEEPFE